MQIHELPEAAASAGAQIAFDTGTNTKKTTARDIGNQAAFVAGESVSFSNLFTPGRLVNARNRAYFCIQLPRAIAATGFNVTFTAASFWMSDGVHAVGSLTDVQNKSVLGAAGTVLMTLPLSAAASVAGSCTCELSGTITFN